MVSDDASERRQAAAPRGHHALRIALTGLLAIVLALAGAAWWLLGSENGAQRVLAMLAPAAGIQAQGVHGKLAGPLQIDRLVVTRPNQSVTLENLRLVWEPRALLHRQLHVISLQVARMLVTNRISQQHEPAALPASLALPLTLRLEQIGIDSGEIGWGPVDLFKLGAFDFALDYDGARYRFDLQRFAARAERDAADVSGSLTGEATLADSRPFALDAHFSSAASAALPDQKINANGTVRLTGSLAELAAAIDIGAQQARIKGHATLQPFTDRLLKDADIALHGVDLSAFRSSLPQTALDGTLTAQATGGALSIANRDAGSWQDRKLPLAKLDIGFSQAGGALTFERIMALLGTSRQPAGTLSGNGKYADGALALKLTADRIDLHRIDRRLHPSQLSGAITARNEQGAQRVTLDLKQPLGKQAMTLAARASIADNQLSLESADLQIGKGHARANGRMELAGRQAFDVDGQIDHLHLRDIGDFSSQLPALDLNGNFSLHGVRAPQLSAKLEFSINDSSLAGRPLRGQGSARLAGSTVTVPAMFIAAGDNRLDIHGELSSEVSRLAFTIAAPKLDQLGADMSGALHLDGTARGSLKKPRIVADWQAERLQAPGNVQAAAARGHADVTLDASRPFATASAAIDVTANDVALAARRVGVLNAHLQYGAQPDAPLNVQLHAQRIDTPQLLADTFDATVQGTTAAHALHAVLTESVNVQTWTLDAAGGLHTQAGSPSWQGRIDRFDAAGRFKARLLSPAPLTVARNNVDLENFALDTSTGRITVDRFIRDKKGMTTSGRAEQVPLAQLLQFRGAQPALATDLQFGATWDITLASGLRGTIDVQRQGGDVTVLGGTPVKLGLRELRASLNADEQRIHLKIDAQGSQVGEIRLDASMAARHGHFPPAQDAAISGRAVIAIPSLSWAASLLSPGTVGGGSLNGEMTLAGTYGNPELKGSIAGRALKLYHGDTGVDLQNGTLDADFSGDRLLLRNLVFRSDGGMLSASGPISFEGGMPDASIALKMQSFRLLNRSDRKLTLSGAGDFGWRQKRLNAAGSFKIDSGFFDIGREGAPELSDDVVIVGRQENTSAPPAADIDIGIDLGDDMKISGRGLNAELGGQLRINSGPGKTLLAHGSVRVTHGTYTAYGRELAIEQGVLRFSGDLHNPALDVLAMRRGLEVEAGVAVRGTVMAPRVTLVSEPSVPEAEKLSWLVLGRSLSSAGSSDMGSLQSAATALLSQSAASGITSQIATAFGLDTLSVGTTDDNLKQRIVTIGKKISSRLYVGYQQTLQTAGSVVNLRYTLSPRLTVEAEAGTRSALSLLYNIAFE